MLMDTKAQVGIGTLIIFIAMVLVAAVAAAVLIQTSGVLQQQAQATGKEATQEVSSNIQIRNVEGVRAANNTGVDMANNISLLRFTAGLNVGSSPVDVNQLIITISDGSTTNNLIYANNDKTYDTIMDNFSTSGSAEDNLKELLTENTNILTGESANAKHFFTVGKVRDEDGSFTQENPIMNTGDLVIFYVSTVASGDTDYDKVSGIDGTISDLKDSGLVISPRTTMNIVFTPEAGATTTVSFVTPSSYGVRETVRLYP